MASQVPRILYYSHTHSAMVKRYVCPVPCRAWQSRTLVVVQAMRGGPVAAGLSAAFGTSGLSRGGVAPGTSADSNRGTGRAKTAAQPLFKSTSAREHARTPRTQRTHGDLLGGA